MEVQNTTLSIHDRLRMRNTEVLMPRLGFGVYMLRSETCTPACLTALAAGYRHIDSAQLYRNEAHVHDAVQRCGLPRADIFLTTKVGIARGSDEKAYQSALDTVTKLGGPDGYVDLFLVHVPGPRRLHRERLWKVAEKLFAEGRARSIGVSNFRIHHIEEMKMYAKVWPPHVNQIELHPWCQQRELVEYCRANDVVVQAYSPLARGARLHDPTVTSLASKRGKSVAQILIRYSLQKGWTPLPKSEREERIRENIDVFDFELDEDEMSMLDKLDEGSKGAIFTANVD